MNAFTRWNRQGLRILHAVLHFKKAIQMRNTKLFHEWLSLQLAVYTWPKYYVPYFFLAFYEIYHGCWEYDPLRKKKTSIHEKTPKGGGDASEFPYVSYWELMFIRFLVQNTSLKDDALIYAHYRIAHIQYLIEDFHHVDLTFYNASVFRRKHSYIFGQTQYYSYLNHQNAWT